MWWSNYQHQVKQRGRTWNLCQSSSSPALRKATPIANNFNSVIFKAKSKKINKHPWNGAIQIPVTECFDQDNQGKKKKMVSMIAHIPGITWQKMDKAKLIEGPQSRTMAGNQGFTCRSSHMTYNDPPVTITTPLVGKQRSRWKIITLHKYIIYECSHQTVKKWNSLFTQTQWAKINYFWGIEEISWSGCYSTSWKFHAAYKITQSPDAKGNVFSSSLFLHYRNMYRPQDCYHADKFFHGD